MPGSLLIPGRIPCSITIVLELPMEIVSEPDMRSAKEARACRSRPKIPSATPRADCDMEKGMMRLTPASPLRPMGENKLYPRAEIKNLNSFRSWKQPLNTKSSAKKDVASWCTFGHRANCGLG